MRIFGWGKRAAPDPRTAAAAKIAALGWSDFSTVTARFRAIAALLGPCAAVADERQTFTYAELSALSDRVAGAIRASAGDADGPVAVLLHHEARYAAAILGSLAAGRGYVALDAAHPIDRNRLIADHAGCVAVIAAGEAARGLFSEDIAVIDIADLADAASPAPDADDPEGLAWIIYTSGSTGAPKGVFQNQRGFLRDLAQLSGSMELGPQDNVAVTASPSLILGARSLMSALLNGATAHVIAPVALGPAGLLQEIRARRMSVARFVPALFRAVVEELSEGERIETLRVVYLSGDRVSWKDVDRFRRACSPDATLIVSLGSTEASTTYIQWRVDPALPERGLQVPVGRALPIRPVKLVDEAGREVAPGEAGEFVVVSDYLSLGYWREPEMTAARFGVDPDRPGMRTFRTGDLGRLRPDGLFDLIGRKDQQVKLAGRRIEPGEVESALKSQPGVLDAAIVVRRRPDGEAQALVGYCELEAGVSGLLPRHLSAMMAQSLPPFMVPAVIVVLDRLPRLPNMKTDHQRLAELDRARAEPTAAAADALMDRVRAIFESGLEIVGATPEDSVSSLGGDSLQAVRVMIAIEKEFGIALPSDVSEMAHTIREIAEWIAARRAAPPAAD